MNRNLSAHYLKFGTHLIENSNSTAPAEISLLDDDPNAMALLCEILHHRCQLTHDLFVIENFSGLRKLAVVSDKYNCVAAVSFATNSWIQALEPLEAKATPDDLFQALEVAYILDHAILFERVTKRILMNDVGGILDRMIGWTTDNILPIRVYGKHFRLLCLRL
jgi:hypothetical protein